ncbi:2-phospho-L-lactate guanylyltransferase [Aeromicrobium wangtongii]|uniref:2-phospho-L-lactate guanylyltransferase n=1 Tax=Aeromicrobium wangtongii TaxID=2969247 RepID=A0ABY5M7W8_9ACTN|nr:2-phospho-L-lactate guanylyltransferase [Aeromicrobium wangtongii]MCD9198928.1 2-phospho-L-lactate guanylyltransferase [Aeromicrobium wangtongii]UUP13034.1 2-phospho-L-lactate guanylyltransferase [Aeromicrobium wangtongii]
MTGWTAVVPVKPWGLAKSRLDLPDDDRMRLARAFSLDVLDVVLAAASVDRVVVVTAEAELGAIARRRGAAVLTDRPMLARGLLNRAVDAGRQWAKINAAGAPIVVVPGDLAALDAGVLDATLGLLAQQERAFVPDASGMGTTLLAAARPELLIPAYGERSAMHHSDAGYRAVPQVDKRCRRDVDTAADLAEARALGVGPHTIAALEQMTSAIREGRDRMRMPAG